MHADLKDSALAHLPSGRFTANAAWLVLAVIAFNLTRAAATLTGSRGQVPDRHHPPHAGHGARTDRILGPTPDPAPTARLAMGISLEHPVQQPVSPTSAAHRLTPRPHRPLDTKDPQEQPDTQVGPSATPTPQHTPTSTRTTEINITPTVDRWIEAKTGTRTIPASTELMRLYADYLNREYGSLDSDYVFVNLWSAPLGRPWSYSAVYDLVERLRTRTGIASGHISFGTPTRPGCFAAVPGWRA